MDISTFLGLFLGFGAIIFGNMMEGGHLSSLIQPTAFFIVAGGTAGAAVGSFPLSDIKITLSSIVYLWKPPRSDVGKLIDEVLKMCTLARKEGILSLENELRNVTNPFLKKGLSLVVDGVEAEMLIATMETEIETNEHHMKIGSEVLEAAGGYAPTIGIIGAVLGLIHVMSNLDKPEELGGGIAVAFVATIYGLLIANIVCIPAGTKLKLLAKELTKERQIMLQGLVSLQNGENPHYVEKRLYAFMHGDHGGAKHGEKK